MATPTEVFDRFAARAFFASAWADQCEESGKSRMLVGREIMDLIPNEFDPAAWHAARTLRMDMERVNACTVAELHNRVRPLAQYPVGGLDLMSEFAHYCAMQSMGHGVGLGDFGEDCRAAVVVPYCEFGSHSLERDYF